MDHEIQLITDDDGFALIGDPVAIDLFLASEGLPSRDLGLQRLGTVLGTGAGVAQAGSEIAASSGRWVKLTEKSAKALDKGTLMKGSEAGVSRAVLTENGKTKGILEIVTKPGTALTSPAMLAGAAGLMAQLAMQQTMDEIIDYLATIDEKVDDILRAQKDAVFADMIGVDFVIDDAMTIREHVGRVSEVSWSKVQNTSLTIARTQAYALRQLDALAEKMEQKNSVGDLAKTSKHAEVKVQEWLAVLARCFQLQDAIAVLELDRVLDASPLELEQHRTALRATRQHRLELIARSTEQLLARMDAAAHTANAKILLHPRPSRAVVASTSLVAESVVDFHDLLGIEGGHQSPEARRWVEAATEVRGKALEAGGARVDAAKQLGSGAFGRAKSVKGKVSNGLAERAHRRRGDEEDVDQS